MEATKEATLTATTHDSVDSAQFVEAYQKRLPEILAVPESDFTTINVDIPTVVTMVLGAMPEILALRGGIAALAVVDQKAVDGLRDYALAAGQANSIYTTAITPRDDIASLNEQALRLRDVLKSDAAALANRGLIDPARLAPLKGAIGYKNVAFELIDYANLFTSCWDAIDNKTALQEAEIDQARKLGEQLVFAVGQRDQAPVVLAEAARVRQQAYTLFFNAYSEVRRAIQFLRYYEGDVESIAPSLFTGRGGRPKVAGDDGALPAGTPAAVTNPSGATSPAAPPAPAPIPVGMPGSSPFIR